MSAPERLNIHKTLGGGYAHFDGTDGTKYLRLDIHRAELAQVHDLYASLARKGSTTDFIRETAERAAEALRGEGR